MAQVVYSKNHNFLRSVGFLAVLAAVTWPWYHVTQLYKIYLVILRAFATQVRNTRKGGLLFFAPPWVFLNLVCKQV